MADGKTQLNDVGTRCRPGDIAGGERGVGETVEETRIDCIVRFQFDFEAGEEAAIG